MANISDLTPETRKSILDALDSILEGPVVTHVIHMEEPMTEVRERDAGALRDADAIIAELAAKGHGDYSQHRDEIADLWDGEYGLWNGNDDCQTDFDSGLRNLWLIQEDHYDQHMTKSDGKPAWNTMICYQGDYVFFA